MTAAFQRALAAIQKEGSIVEQVESRQPEELVLHVRTQNGPRWFAFGRNGAVNLDPFADPLLPSSSHFGERRGTEEVLVLAYRPGRRLVLRCGKGNRSRIVKGYRRGRLERSVVRHCLAYEALRMGGLTAPELFDRDEAMAYVTVEDLGGLQLSLDHSQQHRFARIGHALRRFQENDVDRGFECLELHDAARELENLDRVAASVRSIRGDVFPEWERARGELAERRGELLESVPVPVHRDLHDGQLLDLEPQTGLIDFDVTCRGDNALDIANLSVHLELRSLQQIRSASEESAASLSRSLLSGLARRDEAGFLDRFAFYRAATFLRLAWIYRFRPPWYHVCEHLERRAHACHEEVSRGLV